MNAAPMSMNTSGVIGVTMDAGMVMPQISEKMISRE